MDIYIMLDLYKLRQTAGGNDAKCLFCVQHWKTSFSANLFMSNTVAEEFQILLAIQSCVQCLMLGE